MAQILHHIWVNQIAKCDEAIFLKIIIIIIISKKLILKNKNN